MQTPQTYVAQDTNQNSNLSFTDPAALADPALVPQLPTYVPLDISVTSPPETNEKQKTPKKQGGKKRKDPALDVEMKESAIVSADGKRSTRGKHLETYNETKLAAKGIEVPKPTVSPPKQKTEETKRVYVQEVDPLKPYELITLNIEGEEDI
jgi:hypothetical protein